MVPSEHVLLMTVDLPLPNRRARLAALPFAVEDRTTGEVLGFVAVNMEPSDHEPELGWFDASTTFTALRPHARRAAS